MFLKLVSYIVGVLEATDPCGLVLANVGIKITYIHLKGSIPRLCACVCASVCRVVLGLTVFFFFLISFLVYDVFGVVACSSVEHLGSIKENADRSLGKHINMIRFLPMFVTHISPTLLR